MTSTWTLYSISGVIFLGVGDSMAAIGGKAYGKTKWREYSNKTTHGTSYLIFSTCIVYYFACSLIDEYHITLFLCYVFAGIPAGVLEGCTYQYDNLICSVAYYTFVVMLVALFDGL